MLVGKEIKPCIEVCAICFVFIGFSLLNISINTYLIGLIFGSYKLILLLILGLLIYLFEIMLAMLIHSYYQIIHKKYIEYEIINDV